ncbi:MAG: pyridoxal phosphate-dependent aminotransferase [Coriobacteriia bacterium]|nr:pyridoxal phosphate-dependent aminotransferase [Coriobacteriia bacterium]
MHYDFDTVIDRHNTNSVKCDFACERGKPEGLLPLWLADMDFAAPPEVLDDLTRAVAHGIFGYSEPQNAYYEAVTTWFATRFGYRVEPHEIIKTPGIVFAMAQAIRALTEPGEAVLIQTPIYYPFYHVIADNNRTIVKNPLAYREGRYSIDFAAFEQTIVEQGIRLFILCSPHNPVGRVWTRAELEQLSDICTRHNVTVFSDEIHGDFVWEGHEHTCFGLIDERAIIATAPSKTFNLAGLQTSNVFVKDVGLHAALSAEIQRSGYSQLNTLGLVACQSAYTHGAPWLEALRAYLVANIDFTREFLTQRLPGVTLAEPEGMYLLWLDFSAYGLGQKELDRRIVEDAGLWLSSGTVFGDEGVGFQRINVACPRSVLADALERLARAF